MKYISTRGEAPTLEFEEVLLTGLAADGGLYVPESWPKISHRDLTLMADKSYADIAFEVINPFIGNAIEADALRSMLTETYKTFAHQAVTPLSQIGDDEWLLELFHGPTLAFKDLAMQLLGRLFDHVLKKKSESITLIGATSGDTGSAAIEAMRGRSSVQIFILHPHGRVSEVQRRQMTTVVEDNVHNIAIEGNFDDCQAIVKALFRDDALRQDLRLSGVNSINWARIMGQIVYYFFASLKLGGPHRAMQYAVPTGNFGDIFAGYVAKRMGLPISQLIIGTNQNDILRRTLDTGDYRVEGVQASMSPSIDIQVSSNFERLIFDAEDRRPETVRDYMNSLSAQKSFALSKAAHQRIRREFVAASASEAQTLDTIRGVYTSTGQIVDPHTAVGIHAGRAARAKTLAPIVYLATAHPAKFPDAVDRAVAKQPTLPPHLSDLYDRAERFDVLANDVDLVTSYLRERAK